MPMSNIFLDATVVIPTWNQVDDNFQLECHKITNLNTPAVQNILFYLEEGDILKIKNLGALLIKDIGYNSNASITITCKRVRRHYET